MPPPSSYRERLWASVPLGPVARAAALQTVTGVALVAQIDVASSARTAIAAACALSVLALPLGRLAAHLSRDHPSVYWWSGRAWAVAIPTLFAKTIPAAFDGTGVAAAARLTATPFLFAAMVGLTFGIGAQGALLGVPTDTAMNLEVLMLAMSAIKLQAAFTPAYLVVHVAALGGLALGYACVAKYADQHEAMHEAASAVVRGAAAREPFVVTDAVLNVRAVNQCLLDVLGYEDEHELVGRPVMELLDEASSWGGDHAWIRRTLFEAAARKVNPNGHVWSVRTKDGRALPVRITLGETRCTVSLTRMFTAQFSSMHLEQRNAQLVCEKEKLAWEVASHHDGDWADPREALGASMHGADAFHRTLGAMQDQATTDKAVSCAHSFDHVESSAASPTVPTHALIAPARASSSIESLPSSSVMDTMSQAAKKSPTRAPPPPKTRPSRPKTVSSEPLGSKPKAGNQELKRALPLVEGDPRECS